MFFFLIQLLLKCRPFLPLLILVKLLSCIIGVFSEVDYVACLQPPFGGYPNSYHQGANDASPPGSSL